MKPSRFWFAPVVRVVAVLCLVGAMGTPLAHSQVSFFTPPTYAGSGTNLFSADFNGDGKPDILASDGTLSLGNGNGTFTTGIPVSGTPLAVADFNGDGKADILEQGTGTLLVLLGNGDGTFQAPISTPSGASLTLVVTGDLRGDGKVDVLGIFNGSLMVYLGKGDGTFATGVPYSLPLGDSLIVGDVNGDGKTDITVISRAATAVGQVLVLLGNGDGTLQSPKTSTGVSSLPFFPLSAVEGDFNGDGKTDLAVNSGPLCSTTCPPGPYNISLLLGNGDGTFQPPTAVISGNGPLATADFNGDGLPDLVLEGDSTAAQIFVSNGDGTFSNASNYVLSLPSELDTPDPTGIAVADFNLDGKLDIAVGNAVLLGNGNGTFQGIQFGVVPGTTTAAVIGDFDTNGPPEVAVTSTQVIGTSYVYDVNILSNNGSGAVSLAHTYALQEPGLGIVTSDFNGDGNLDLLVVSTDPGTEDWGYSVLLGNGDGSFQSPVFYPQNVDTASPSYSIVVADFNNDHKPDIAITMSGDTGNQTLAVLLGNGDGTFAGPTYFFDEGAGSLVTADFNGDGKLDIAGGILLAGNTGPPLTTILFGNGDGTFQAAVFPPSLNNFAAEFTADFNGDGKPDLLSSNQVALGNGDGTFTLLPPFPYDAHAVADLNGDGKLDLFVGGTVQSGVLLGNGDGTFGSRINVPPSGLLQTPPLVADMNGDGRPDLVFLPSFVTGGPLVQGVAVLLNTTPPGFEFSAGALSPSTVTAGGSASSTVNVAPTFGFKGTVTLACTGLPSGASCGFVPPSIAVSSGTSKLTITTTASTAAGTYPVTVQGSSGSIVNSVAVSLVVQATPDFTISPASGSPTSQTIGAGQSAKFSLLVTPSGSFTGTVDLSCGITPVVTPAPTCSLSSSSVQLTGTGAEPITVTVGTTASMTTGMVSHVDFPPGALPLAWTVMLLGSGWLLLWNRKRLPAVAAPLIVLALASWVGCGGGGMSSQTTPGTPAGTYTATVKATSGTLNHNMTLTVVVQ